jgi:hypothetical protein
VVAANNAGLRADLDDDTFKRQAWDRVRPVVQAVAAIHNIYRYDRPDLADEPFAYLKLLQTAAGRGKR